MKIVINKCFGGFGLSPVAEVALYEAGWREMGVPVDEWFGARSSERKTSELSKWREFVAGGMKARDLFITTFSSDEKFCLRFPSGDQYRADPRLVAIVEKMGDAAGGSLSKLRIVDVPDGVEWEIDDYDSQESVREKHRSWP